MALGVGFFSFLANTKETGAGFLKVLCAICGGSSFLALIIHQSYGSLTDLQSIYYFVSTIAFVFVYFWHQDKKSILMWGLYGLHNLALLLLLVEMNNNNWAHVAFAFTSIFFLGSITYAMIMGHWYLVTPKLSEKPLKIALYFMWGFFVVKLAWTVSGYLEGQKFFEPFTQLGGGYSFNWLMLAMRAGWGYLVLGPMSYFAYRLVAMRSIQSATGMLYAMTFFVFVAELVSMYMFYEYGVYI